MITSLLRVWDPPGTNLSLHHPRHVHVDIELGYFKDLATRATVRTWLEWTWRNSKRGTANHLEL